jgi:LysM repeat protein
MNKTQTALPHITAGYSRIGPGWRGSVIVAWILAVLLLPGVASQVVRAQDTGPLFSEGFEGDFTADPYCKTGICNVPSGWGVWFIPRRETDQPGINFQPEYTQIKDPNRLKSGTAAMRIATSNATHTGGIFRIVTNVKVGAKLRFSAWGESWSTNDESPISARPSQNIKLKIGVDPMGGNNGQASPLNGQVIWSDEHDAKDAFTQFSVETEAKSPTVIVYVYSTMQDPVRHNEVFWDDAVLEYTAPPPTPTPTLQVGTPVSGTPQVNTTTAPAATSAPLVQATGGITYTVVEGDTLFDIAMKYKKSVEEIKRLNGLTNDLLSIGDILIIEPASQAASTVVAALQPTSNVSATATPVAGAICVQAYFDNDGNGQRDPGEDLVPNVLFNVTAKGNSIASYKTDGTTEPFCIGNLDAGPYTVAAVIIPAYVATTPLNDTVNVPGGAAAQFSVGLRRASDGNDVVGVTGTPKAASTSGGGLNILALLSTLVGGLIILGSIGFGVLFFMQSRRL